MADTLTAMVFIETSVFTRQLLELLSDDEYAEVQQTLVAAPHAGPVIEGTGGLRMLRVAAKGKGKRGGARIIYYSVDDAAQVRMLLIYAKSEQADLTAAQKRVLRRLVEEWK
jgi:mRNA-degrading endonuclease RelE of RelBE toxin-antitoxin system